LQGARRILSVVRAVDHDLSVVMRGPDPRIHDEAQQAVPLYWRHSLMDCRVKPGNDSLAYLHT